MDATVGMARTTKVTSSAAGTAWGRDLRYGTAAGKASCAAQYDPLPGPEQ